MSSSIEDLTEAMKDVVDPELGINVVDLGLVYGITLDPSNIAVLDMTLTSVWMPPWGPDKITDSGREQLRALGFTV